MYHGYTLIDAQIEKYCEPLKQAYPRSRTIPMAEAPLFSAKTLEGATGLDQIREGTGQTPPVLDTRKAAQRRDRIREDLEAGAQKIFLIRSLKKYPVLIAPVYVLWAIAWCASLWWLFSQFTAPLVLARDWIHGVLNGVTSGWVAIALKWILTYANLPSRDVWVSGLSNLLGAALVASIAGYILAFPTYCLVRLLAMAADRVDYRHLTNQKQTVQWTVPEQAKPASTGAATPS